MGAFKDICERLDVQDDEDLQSVRYDTDAYIDSAIERIKNRNSEIERFTKIFNDRVTELKMELESKVEKLTKQNQWEESNIRNVIMADPNKKETKTQFKKSFLSGDVVIKKPEQKINKPKLTEEQIKSSLNDYSKSKVELDWETLKPKLAIIKDRVINTETGEDVTDLIPFEETPEKVIIK